MAPNGQGIKFGFPNTSFVPFFNSFPHVFFWGLQESLLGRVLPVSAVASPSLRQ